MILNIIWVLLLAFYGKKSPTIYVILYLFFLSSYGGLFQNFILVGGVEYGQFLVNMLSLLFVLLKWKKTSRNLKHIILFIGLFIIYGIFKPVFDGNQSILASIKASKSMFSYFFMFYILVNHININYLKIFKYIKFIAIYFSCLYIVNDLGISFKPVAYIKDQGEGIQCFYDSFIFLAFCIEIKSMNRIKAQNILTLFILLLGIYLGAYFSLLVSSVAVISVVWLYRVTKSRAMFIMFSLMSLSFIYLISGFMFTSFKDTFLLQIDALNSRDYINEFRLALIVKQPLLGFGFLGWESSLVQSAASHESIYTESFAVIDSGYIDLLGRFGIIGTVMFLLIPIYIIKNSIKDKYTIPFVMLIICFYAVNWTWSVFSYPMGITVLAIVYSFLLQYKNNQNLKYE